MGTGTAMIYRHATSAADRAIAEAVDRAVRADRETDDEDPEEGTAGVHVPAGPSRTCAAAP